ncbi:MAG: symmetrical bis(5'-nucleosyl)-tetraphosphatase [Ideonella sp.]|nr:symmetrical bis(5'-nucleosyl)-tetraphosphatase [Ideonella sp.]MCC7459655.1 symmetrical bis(5'-nucleosyl)-tetraphosphatase [Nitrospira sp.]
MHLLIGDPQGCSAALNRLLDAAGFSPSRDSLHVLGDLVNRGPDNLGVLERLRALGGAATCLLGNHDFHLLAVAAGVRPPHRGDTLHDVLQSPERDGWIDWLRHCKMADRAHGWLLVHAGVPPQWSAEQTLALAAEVEAMLRSEQLAAFLPRMYGNEPARWSDALQGLDRWRAVVNALTRIRFCTDDGTMDFTVKDSAAAAPPGHRPWYDIASRRTRHVPVAFGHWSTLGLLDRPDLLSLDTGCVWGGALSAARIDGGRREVFQVRCAQASRPGA